MEYHKQLEICVEKLKDFLMTCSQQERNEHLKVLAAEKEGWVEYQMSQWCAAEIKTQYNFDVWDTAFYFAIDVCVLLSKDLSF